MAERYGNYLSRVFLLICASAFLYYGAQGFIALAATVCPLGIVVDGSDAITEIRATYGGLFFGIGLFLCYSSFVAHKTGLVSFALMMSAIGLTRLYGIVIDGSGAAIQRQLLAMELIPLAFALALLAVHRTPPKVG